MGATLAVDPESGRGQARGFAGYGLDLVLDACGDDSARQAAFDLCRPGGTVVLLGMAKERSELDFGAGIRKELRVLLSFGYTPVDFRRSLEMLKVIDLSPWTAEMPLDDGQKAFEKMTGSRGDTLKMVLRVS
jgi:threonine dehydrogenase-like Zn-dependent dehydrogenase